MIYFINFLLVFVLSNKTKKEQIIIDKDYIESPTLYKNEICSYNGSPKMISNDSIECTCYSSYTDEPREEHRKFIGNQMVHCSYKRKKRFTAFFLAGLFPIGLDYFYLEHYFYFIIVFTLFLLMLISRVVYFILSYKVKAMHEESKYKYNNKYDNFRRNNIRLKSYKKMDKKEKLKKCLDIHEVINKILSILFIIYWILDIILQARGIITDRYGVETENDMDLLFSREEI
jgi:hypothetical protein